MWSRRCSRGCDPEPDPAADARRAGRPAPGRRSASTRAATLGYRVCRAICVAIVGLWFRPRVQRAGQHARPRGRSILAPVHRSFADFAFSALRHRRKLFFMAKEELWKIGRSAGAARRSGAFPVHRESADREALERAEEVLRRGQLLVMFPEGAAPGGTRSASCPGGGGVPGRPHRGADRPDRDRRLASGPCPRDPSIPKPSGSRLGRRRAGAQPEPQRRGRVARARCTRRPRTADADPGGLRAPARPPIDARGAVSTARALKRSRRQVRRADAGVAEPEEQVGALLRGARGPLVPHGRPLGRPASPAGRR